MLMGLGSAPTFVCTLALATRWFPPAMLAILVALIEALGMLGPALGQEILGWIVQTSGWRAGMMACGWFGLVLLFMILFLVRNSPGADHPTEMRSPRPSMVELARECCSRCDSS
jgi:MFS family permease